MTEVGEVPNRRTIWLIDALFLVAALVEGLLSATWSQSVWAQVWCYVAVAGLLVRRRYPWVSMLLALPSIVVAQALLAGLVALYSVAAVDRRRPVIVVSGLALFAAAIPQWWGTDDLQDLLLSIIYSAMAAAGAIALGLLARTRRALRRRIDELSAAREEERKRDELEILTVERARIAREMHDVVSHQVSLIAVRSGALQMNASDVPTADAARIIRGLSVETLNELRQMVTVLRADAAAEESIAPQPSVAEVPALIRASDLDVVYDLRIPNGLTAAAQRALFRTVQEGLTNARKHAPGARVELTMAVEGADVVLRLTNSRGDGADEAPLPGSGHGLVGLSERAEMLGGTVLTRRDDDRFTLEMRLPRPAGDGGSTVLASPTEVAPPG